MQKGKTKIVDFHIINSANSLKDFMNYVVAIYQDYKYITFLKPRIGEKRSLDQNSLFHVWLTIFIAAKLDKDRKEVTKAELAGIKRTIKKLAYLHLRESFLIHEITDYSTGEIKKDYTSSSDWKRGEMYAVLNFFQMMAADQGVVLESAGEFKQLQNHEVS